MVFFGVIASSCGLVHLCPGTYYRPLWRKLISFLISLWYLSTFVFAFLNWVAWRGRAGAGAVVERERGTARGIFVFFSIVL